MCVIITKYYGNRDSAKVTEATIWRLLAKVCQAESGRRRRWNTQNPLNHPSQPHPGARSDGIPCPICPTHKQNCVQTPGMPDMYSFFQSNHCHQHLVYHDQGWIFYFTSRFRSLLFSWFRSSPALQNHNKQCRNSRSEIKYSALLISWRRPVSMTLATLIGKILLERTDGHISNFVGNVYQDSRTGTVPHG